MASNRKQKLKKLRHVKEVQETCRKARKVWAGQPSVPVVETPPEPLYLVDAPRVEPKRRASLAAMQAALLSPLFFLAFQVLYLRVQYDTHDLLLDILGGLRTTALVTFVWVPVMSGLSVVGGFVWWVATQIFFEALPVNLFLSW